MLYIFLVDTGHMIPVDMKLALESVSQLKSEITKQTGIPKDKQVLLISGGESLNSDDRVCSYSAGTDTSPIFLFSKSFIESSEPPLPSVDYGDDCDMKEQVEGCLNMPPTYNTVVTRAQLAQHFYELAKNQRASCERLVYDQHLQQQGWAAVVANLEDIVSSLKNKQSSFEDNFRQYLKSQQNYRDLVKSFSHDISILSKIPVLPALLTKQEINSLDSAGMTLLQWISSKDNRSSLQQIKDQCINGLNKVDNNTFETLCTEIEKALEAVDRPHMKEIKGLEERLMGLETLMCNAKRCESDQGDLAQSLLNNQNQAGKIGDMSILPDLCISHQKQLELLLKNHQSLRDIRRRCIRAKEELSINLHSRLRWIMFVEKNLCDVENKLILYHNILKRLRRYLEVVQQIHLAPRIYLTAVVEVVRRRNFSRSFVQWAGSLSQQSLELHKMEVETRKQFNHHITNHFLHALFPGMRDMPPPFAVQSPTIFDAELPNIGIEDIEILKEKLPELASYLKIPTLTTLPRMPSTPTDSALGSDIPSRTLGAYSIASPTSLEPLPHLLETHEFAMDAFSEMDREILSLASEPSPSSESFECTEGDGISKQQIKSPNRRKHDSSEKLPKENFFPIEKEYQGGDSDAEEFEQVGDLPKDQTSAELRKENLDFNKSQLEKVKHTMTSLLQELFWEVKNQLKPDVVQLRDQVLEGKGMLFKEVSCITAQLNDALKQIQEQIEFDKNEEAQQAVNEIKQEKQAMIMHYQEKLEVESQKLDDAHRQVEMYYDQLQHYSNLLDNLKIENEAQLLEAKKEIKEENNKMVKTMMLEHELELENLKEEWSKKIKAQEETIKDLKEVIIENENQIHLLCKDKKSLESIFTERLQQEKTQLQQMLEEKYKEQENTAVRQALEVQKDIHRKDYQRLQLQRDQYERELQENIRRTFEIEWEEKMQKYKEDVIEINNHHQILSQVRMQCEEEKLRSIAEVIEMQEKKHQSETETLKLKFQQYEEQLSLMQAEFETERQKLHDKETELTVIKQKLIEQTSTSAHILVSSDKVSVLTCNIGDVILLCFDEKHDNYMVFFLGPVLHFLHTDCLETLGFKNVPEENRKTWALAEVIDKEYCLAKKPHNRYKVPIGTRFYRVKAKPWDKEVAVRRHHHQRRSSSVGGGETATVDSSHSSSISVSSTSAEIVSSPSNMSASVI